MRIKNQEMITDMQVTRINNGALGQETFFGNRDDEAGNTEAGGYWDAVQMRFNGAYYYTRLSFKF